MNNLQDDEKDLFIIKKLKKDKFISKKYDDIFEDFLKGDHEMNEKSKIEPKEKLSAEPKKDLKIEQMSEKEKTNEKTKKTKNKWINPFATVAACALIITGANVYASTKGYDNIFFLIRDLGKNKTITAQKDEILSDRDTTISYTDIKIADGLFIQINKFIIKDGKASLVVRVNQEKTSVKPYKFIVTSNEETLANEKIMEGKQILAENFDKNNNSFISQYTYEIKFNNNYVENMNKLSLRIEDKDENEIATIEIDLENKEIDLISSSEEEIKKVSEIDLKEKLGYYAILFNPNATSKYPTEDELFYLGSNLYINSTNESTKLSKDGYSYYPDDEIKSALKEAIGDESNNIKELGTKIHSDNFTYDQSLFAYKYTVSSDIITYGLCLNIDDLQYKNGKYNVTFTFCLPTEADYLEGTIEKLDRYQATVQFLLNENGKYTKYKLINLGEVECKKLEKNNNSNNNQEIVNISNTVSKTNNVNNYNTVSKTNTISNSNSVSMSNTVSITNTINNSNSVSNSNTSTIYNTSANTTTTNFVEVPSNSNAITNTNYDINSVNNYASTMSWVEYWAPGLKFKYPTDWEFSIVQYENPEKNLVVNAGSSGWAIGIDREINKIIESYMTIEVFDQIIVDACTPEEAYQKLATEHALSEKVGIYYTNNNGDEWHEFRDSNKLYDPIEDDTYYVSADALWDGGKQEKYLMNIVRITTNNRNNYKVTNIINYVIGSLKKTSR